ncbi:MAG: ThiF family adenylyltransferase [Planctomycetaceae bacterium]|nr:ThiF family adenylyltransferase [Planctomycetaceae bacterium]
MSQRLVNLNPDLSRLREAGYDIAIGEGNNLLVRDVPYVNSQKEVKRGILVSDLDLAGDSTVPPRDHVVFFVGDFPCNVDGTPIAGVSKNTNKAYGEHLLPNHQISRKPTTGPNAGKYADYHEKITTYIAIICSPAFAIDPTATATTHPVVVPDEGESVFNYLDTAATKAGIVVANNKLERGKVAIVGAGATGSYILDLIAKTPVPEIHLFDRDIFLNHNAFRCPGAPSIGELRKKQQKVQYLAEIYLRMRKNVFAHDCFIDESTVEQLKTIDFVFICIDKGTGKELIVQRLEEWGIPFIDVGMGIQLGEDNTLAGIVTATTSTPSKRDHFRKRVAFSDGEAANEYSRNVQIAELNALNAALAVIKWKKLWGYYDDGKKEHWCAYTLRSNRLDSEDTNEA